MTGVGSDVLHALSLVDAFVCKMATNGENYPVHLARGSAAKYDELREPPQPQP